MSLCRVTRNNVTKSEAGFPVTAVNLADAFWDHGFSGIRPVRRSVSDHFCRPETETVNKTVKKYQFMSVCAWVLGIFHSNRFCDNAQ